MDDTAIKKRTPVVALKNWPMLREVVADGYRDAVECRALIDIYQSGQAAYLALNSCPAGPAFQYVCLALSYRLQLLVVRAYGDVRYGDDRNLRAAITFLQEGSRFDELDSNANRDLLDAAIQRFNFALEDRRLTRLKKMRDKRVAHIAVYNYGPESPTYPELFEFAEVTIQIWKNLALGLKVMPENLGTSMEAADASAKAFWKPWTQV